MKKIVFKLAVLAIGVSALQGCKKGEEDPFMSLRSRKARLTGEWKMTDFKASYYEDGTMYDQYTYDGTYMTSTDGDLYTFSQEFTFEKDGTYEQVSVMEGETSTTEGNWVFMGKSKEADIKKKEYVLLDETTLTGDGYVTTYSNFSDGNAVAYHIKKLSNKEIIMETVIEYTDTDGYNYKDEVSFTLTKK